MSLDSKYVKHGHSPISDHLPTLAHAINFQSMAEAGRALMPPRNGESIRNSLSRIEALTGEVIYTADPVNNKYGVTFSPFAHELVAQWNREKPVFHVANNLVNELKKQRDPLPAPCWMIHLNGKALRFNGTQQWESYADAYHALRQWVVSTGVTDNVSEVIRAMTDNFHLRISEH